MNYQSAVCFGRAKKIEDRDKKACIFENMVSRYFKGREAGRDYEAPTPANFKSTVVLEVTIENWSAKERHGGPSGPKDHDSKALGTAGVIDIQSTPSV